MFVIVHAVTVTVTYGLRVPEAMHVDIDATQLPHIA